ncbi:MAG: potassium transporter TrkA [Acidimicrobiia bacterium]|nr:potassium transporter TrkA [Acidimicrobiia bacterium]
MAELTETSLPGVGVRVEFMSEEGQRVGVVRLKSGDRELFACASSDPDTVAFNVRLSDDESHALADALGGSSIVESLDDMSQRIEGLAIDWLTVSSASPLAGMTIDEARVRSRTGATIVAAIRHGTAHPAPGPEFEIAAADVLVVVGTPEGISEVRHILKSG